MPESHGKGHGSSDPGTQTDLQFNADRKIGRIILTNDNETLYQPYRAMHSIVGQYEDQPAK